MPCRTTQTDTSPTHDERTVIEALRESESRYRLLADNSRDLISRRTAAGIVLYASPACERLLGYRADELVGRSVFGLIPPEDWPLLEANRARFQRGESFLPVVHRIRHKNGAFLWFEMVSTPITDPQTGELLEIQSTSRDVSDRVHAEAALRKSEERYRMIVDTALEGIWVLDQDARTSFVNRRMADMLGYSVEEMQGTSLFAFMDAAVQAEAMQMFERRTQGIAEEHDFRFTRKDGSVLWTIISTVPLHDDTGEFLGTLGMVTDITARKRAEEALRESEHRFRTLVEAAPVGACVIDADGIFEAVNEAFCAIYEYTREEFIGHHVRMILPPERRSSDEHRFAARMAAGAEGRDEAEVVTKTGKRLRILSDSVQIIGADGRRRRASFVIDITDRTRREEKRAYEAQFDTLTGLPNRALFYERVTEALAHVDADGRGVAVLFLDLDGFKRVNDSYGHAVGDRVLTGVGHRLVQSVRRTDTVARLGGDEFVVLLTDLRHAEHAAVVAEKLIGAVHRAGAAMPQAVQISTSVGIALSGDDGADAHLLIEAADMAMYAAKRAGKDRYTFAAKSAAAGE